MSGAGGFVSSTGITVVGEAPLSATTETLAAAANSDPFSDSSIAATSSSGFGDPFAGTGSTSSSSAFAPTAAPPITDMRARLSPLNSSVYGSLGASNLLSVLQATNGIIFPYTPTVTGQQDVNYQEVSLTHTNTDYMAYQKTPSVTLTVSAKFTVQNAYEGAYSMGVIHFLRTVSKMYFGVAAQKAGNAGLPPPLLQFSAFGTYMFNKLPVILKSHNFSIGDGADLVKVSLPGGTVLLPAIFDLSLTLQVQNTPSQQVNVFDLEKFRTGALLAQGGWI